MVLLALVWHRLLPLLPSMPASLLLLLQTLHASY
jgi:hypothetical protein